MKIIILIIINLICLHVIAQENNFNTIHVFVALCDNKSQGIVPVSKTLGNGDEPRNNLYWGAGAGVKTFFRRSKNWDLIYSAKVNNMILERCVFKHKNNKTYLVADAYKGNEINECISDFLKALAGSLKKRISLKNLNINAGSSSELIVYVGHDGLMDLYKPKILTWKENSSYPKRKDKGKPRKAILLCCIAKEYFKIPLKKAKAYPLLWTTGLMAPEAYTLEAAIKGWILNETNLEIRNRAAEAYNKYQRCGLRAAKRLFVTGW